MNSPFLILNTKKLHIHKKKAGGNRITPRVQTATGRKSTTHQKKHIKNTKILKLPAQR